MPFPVTSDEFNDSFAAWLRIEPRCRQDNFARGIQVRTADPLWMLARQWQTGEFLGEDTGSPIKVEMRYTTQSLGQVKLGAEAQQPLPPDVPLETLVEQEPDVIDYRERVRIGQEFERRLRAEWSEAGTTVDVEEYIIKLRAQKTIGFPCTDHPLMYELDYTTQRFVRFMQGKVIDGLAVLNGPMPDPADTVETQTVITKAQDAIQEWHSKVCRRPNSTQSPAWQPEKLDYRFENRHATTTGGEGTRLIAPDYRNGEVDWYTFSAEGKARGDWQKPTDPKLNPVVTTPTRIQVMGTSPRWWAFEDSNTDFGAMDVAKPDLAKLLLMEFVLIYGDDWFSVPAPVSMGSLVRVEELKVWNVFGEVTTVEPARRAYPEGTDWDKLEPGGARPQETLPNLSRFDLFTLSGATPQQPGLDVRVKVPLASAQPAGLPSDLAQQGAGAGYPALPRRLQPKFDAMRRSSGTARSAEFQAAPTFTLTPPRPILLVPWVAGFRQESRPLEEVHFIRDEGANMVWAVEHTVPNQLGTPVSGFDAQRERYELWRDALRILQSKLEDFLKLGSPTGEETERLETTIRDVINHITDLSPYARPTPSQNEVMRYRLATIAPENWIPFIPVRRGAIIGTNNAAIQFQRAKMLRNSDHSQMEGQPTLKLSQVLELHQYLDSDPLKTLADVIKEIRRTSPDDSSILHPYELDGSIPSMSKLLALDENALMFIYEESISRAGLRVQLTRQRARWVDGSTHVWVGRKVLTGKGEGNSGLRFDVTNE